MNPFASQSSNSLHNVQSTKAVKKKPHLPLTQHCHTNSLVKYWFGHDLGFGSAVKLLKECIKLCHLRQNVRSVSAFVCAMGGLTLDRHNLTGLSRTSLSTAGEQTPCLPNLQMTARDGGFASAEIKSQLTGSIWATRRRNREQAEGGSRENVASSWSVNENREGNQIVQEPWRIWIN